MKAETISVILLFIHLLPRLLSPAVVIYRGPKQQFMPTVQLGISTLIWLFLPLQYFIQTMYNI